MNKNNTGILLINLGSPESPSVKDVRTYLKEFLMDKYVIDVPFPIRWMIVNCFVLPFRPKKSAEAYQSIWWDEGSPLIEISKRTQNKLTKKVKEPVFLAMRYGNPSIESVIQDIEEKHPEIDTLKLIPMYPHYAMATTKTVIEKTEEVLEKRNSKIKLKILESFYDNPIYIDALAESIKPYLKNNYDLLLFSYHGVPERHVKKTDPTGKHCLKATNCCYVKNPGQAQCYRHHVVKTTELVMQKCGLTTDQWALSFQSRLGKDPWLSPFTDAELERYAKEGVKRLGIVCPAFVADCLETLEEIGDEGKEIFLEAGGEYYDMIPCLNDQDVWIDALAKLCDNL